MKTKTFLTVPRSPDSPLALSPLEENLMNAEYRVVIPEQVLVNASGSAVGYLLKIEDSIENGTAYLSMVGAMLATVLLLCAPMEVSESSREVRNASLQKLPTLPRGSILPSPI